MVRKGVFIPRGRAVFEEGSLIYWLILFAIGLGLGKICCVIFLTAPFFLRTASRRMLCR